MANPNIAQLVVTTLTSQKKRIVSNVLNNNALLMRLNEKGKIKQKASGGRLFRESLTYQANGTTQYQGEYDTLDTTPYDVISSADYNQKILTGTISLSGLEMHQNAGKEQIFDLMDAKLENLMESLDNTVGASLYSDGTTANEIGGLQQLIADDPTTGTVGGIDRSSYSFWRNKLYDFSVESVTASATTIQGAMNTLYRRCLVQGSEKPDLVLADATYFQFYETSLQTIQRITTSKMADAGFDALKYKSSDVVYDPNCPSAHMYFLNTNHIFLRYLGDSLFNVQSQRVPFNQDAVNVPVIMYANMTMDNARTSGVMHA
jgi:hypothetical protein